MQLALLITLAAILIAVRLPSFFSTQNMSTKERLGLVVIIYSLLGVAFFAVNGAGYLMSLFRIIL